MPVGSLRVGWAAVSGPLQMEYFCVPTPSRMREGTHSTEPLGGQLPLLCSWWLPTLPAAPDSVVAKDGLVLGHTAGCRQETDFSGPGR